MMTRMRRARTNKRWIKNRSIKRAKKSSLRMKSSPSLLKALRSRRAIFISLTSPTTARTTPHLQTLRHAPFERRHQ